MRRSDAVVVVALDHSYFPYLRDLLNSFESSGAAEKYDFAVLDAGLLPEETEWLRRRGVAAIVRAEWPFPGLDGQPEWTKTSYCRPFFPNYFGDWEVIVYFDADSWLQDCAALDAAVAGAREDGFAAVPLVDRGHWPLQGQTHAVFSMHWHKDCLVQYFGQETADRYQLHPILMGGFFAGRRDAPHWRVWQGRMAEGLRRKVHFNIDQASMTLALHGHGLPVHFLPFHYHWACHLAAIGLDAKTGTYVEPYLPHQPISSLGLAAHTKTTPALVRTTDGRLLSRLLHYGQQHQPYAVNVVIEGKAMAFDGIARPRFRDQVFDAASHEGPVRFLQVGAMDGVSFDPIHRHVCRHGWSGILVEPLPDMQARLQENYAGIPGLAFAPVALADASGTVAMQRVRAQAVGGDGLPAWADGIASLAPERNALGGRKIDEAQHRWLRRETETVSVEALSFADFSRRYAVERLDVLQIDVEGYDWRILQQIDLARHAPKCIHMEIVCLPPEEIAEAISHLRGAGYACYAMEDAENLLALRRDFGARHFGVL